MSTWISFAFLGQYSMPCCGKVPNGPSLDPAGGIARVQAGGKTLVVRLADGVLAAAR